MEEERKRSKQERRKIVLVRHGKGNTEKSEVVGRSGYDQLCEQGKVQARFLGKFLHEGFGFSDTFYGTLKRHDDTLSMLKEENVNLGKIQKTEDVDEGPILEIIKMFKPEFREEEEFQKLEEFAKSTTSDPFAQNTIPRLLYMQRRWKSGAIDLEGRGESVKDFKAKLEHLKKQILDNCEGNVLVVTSYQIIPCLIEVFGETAKEKIIPNASVSILELEESGKWKLKDYCRDDFIEEELRTLV